MLAATSRGWEFKSQHPHQTVHNSMTLAPKNLAPSCLCEHTNTHTLRLTQTKCFFFKGIHQLAVKEMLYFVLSWNLAVFS